MGLGGSAALAVAVVRALSRHFGLDLSDSQVNQRAYNCEQVVHGTPSGIDNTVSTYGRFILYRKPEMTELSVSRPIPIVIGLTGISGHTLELVRRVRDARERTPELYDDMFNRIDQLVLAAREAVETYDLETLGQLMNMTHGMLNSLQVSCWELEELVQIARRNGSPGAKLTGAGGGGAMIALAPENADGIAAAMKDAGYQSIITEIGPALAGGGK